MSNIISELKRRNVFRVAGAYAVVAWLLAQMAALLESSMNMPDWFDTVVVSFLLLGLPIALILAWAFESTPEGIKRTAAVDLANSKTEQTGRKLDYALVVGLAVVGLLIIGDRLLPENTTSPKKPAAAINDEFKGQSIAVLPFEDFSPSNDQTYFANGIAEELLNVLARVEGLRVASRTSAFSFQDRDISIAEIGKALNVGHVLEGSIRKAGNTLRITAQLIDTQTDVHLWSQTYDRPLSAENIFEIQDDISKAIVLELNGQLDLIPLSNERPTQSTEAFEAYLKGKEAYGPRGADGIEEGITELIRAVTLDPNFAVAHANLARAYRLANIYGDLANDLASSRSQIHMERALALEPQDWDVLAENAWWLRSKWLQIGDQETSLEEVILAFDAAIVANTNNAEAYRGKGLTLTNAKLFDDAKVALEKARILNPEDPLIYLNLAEAATAQSDAQERLNLAIKAVKINPGTAQPRMVLAASYAILGELEIAHRIYKSCSEERICARNVGNLYSRLNIPISDSSLMSDYAVVTKHYLAEDFDKVEQVLSAVPLVPPYVKVEVYASIGRSDLAYQVIQENPVAFEPFMQGRAGNDVENTITEISILDTLERQGDEKAKVLRQSLSQKYQNVVPGDHSNTTVYQNGAAWHMLNDDPDTAMIWLNALADRGVSDVVGFHTIFKPLEQRADYQAFLARMHGYIARDRALIQAQLDNPPDIWWSPDELPEVEY